VAGPSAETLRGKRDRALLAVLLGCGLRRAELVGLTVEDIQLREEHWVIADLVGKAKHVRTMPVPSWVKAAIDPWTTSARITEGRIFRSINKAGKIWGEGVTPKVIWQVVKAAAGRADIQGLAPMTCGALVPGCAMLLGPSWSRSNSSLDMPRWKRPNAILGASRSYGKPSMIISESSRNESER
jgi:integrase